MIRLVSELTGADLALWVARAEKMITEWVGAPANVWIVREPDLRGLIGYIDGDTHNQYSPHEDWAQAAQSSSVQISHCTRRPALYIAAVGRMLAPAKAASGRRAPGHAAPTASARSARTITVRSWRRCAAMFDTCSATLFRMR